jgi:signal peptidase
MTIRATVGRAVFAGVVTLAVLLVLGSLLGQPIGLGYVETGSMAPTLNAGDGFVAIPGAFAGPVEPGDVVVYRSPGDGGRSLTTHRVVGATEHGFVTRGDANALTDQSAGRPYVHRSDVVATALEVDGRVVVVPALGTAVMAVGDAVERVQRAAAVLVGTRSLLGLRGLAYAFFAVTLAWYVHGLVRGERSRRTTRRTKRATGLSARRIVLAIVAVVLIATTASMVAPSGTSSFEIVSSETNAPGARVLAAGTTERTATELRNSALLPAYAFVDPATDGITVDESVHRIGPGSTTTVHLTIAAPEQTGLYGRSISVHRYPAVLPVGTVEALYDVHPWVPVFVVDVLVAIPLLAVGMLGVGGGRLRTRSRDIHLDVSGRIQALVNRLY